MIKVGCCGFPTSMKKYFESLMLVELNNTFYQYPRPETVEGWRNKAPENFEFTVKAHQDISHKAKMQINPGSIKAFEQMKQICKTLKSKVLLFQTPGSFRPDRLVDAAKFFEGISRENLVFVWETRGASWETPETYKRLGEVLEKLNVTHVTDPLRIEPAYTGEIAYFRLHGLGEQMYYYQHSDMELQRLWNVVSSYERKCREVYVLFNNLSMFDDALRFKQFLATGKFPKITASTGLASIKEVAAKTRYPASKSILMKKIGWKLVEIEDGKQIRLGEILADLPSKSYKNVEELLNDIKATKKIDN
ncbi:MAG: DUF72 domain-containing protein [Candidatus Bathyarchaeia archaeon]